MSSKIVWAKKFCQKGVETSGVLSGHMSYEMAVGEYPEMYQITNDFINDHKMVQNTTDGACKDFSALYGSCYGIMKYWSFKSLKTKI